MSADKKLARFDALIMPHLDAAYNLARWLTRNPHDADDVVQEACTRAYASFDSFRAINAKAWLLTIVRNSFLKQIEKQKRGGEIVHLDVEQTTLGDHDNNDAYDRHNDNPEVIAMRQYEAEQIHKGIMALTDEYREIIILREIEGFTYHEIADITGTPVGTVMSRLSRARQKLQQKLTGIKRSREKTQ